MTLLLKVNSGVRIEAGISGSGLNRERIAKYKTNLHIFQVSNF